MQNGELEEKRSVVKLSFHVVELVSQSFSKT
jgi:hypothetical protein